jgi:hypothetical protein
MQKQRYVIDTTSLISYFSNLFGRGSRISDRSISLIDKAFRFEDSAILVIPSIVFVEIFDKWFRGIQPADQEFKERFKIEVLYRIRLANNIEIRELDKEVLEAFLLLDDPNINLENHDKIILASAIVLNAPLITSDSNVISFIKRYQVIPDVLS